LKVKIVHIISDINKARAFEWLAEKIDKERFVPIFLLLNPFPSVLEEHLYQNGFEVHYIRCRGKRDWPFALLRLYRFLRQVKPAAVHCHLFQANILGLTAARAAGVQKRIYTRHHSSLHHIYFKRGVWWDRRSNKLATKIVAVSNVVKKILVEWESVSENKVALIPHGFQLDEFAEVSAERIEDFKRRNGLVGKHPIVGVVSRFTEWKGIQYIIPAFERFLGREKNAILILLNATGDFEAEIKALLKKIPFSSYRLISFENDITAAYKAMNLFIHVPVDEHSEAFGQVYVEALAAEVPSIFTLSGIAQEFIVNEKNALVVPFRDSQAIYDSMVRIMHDGKLNCTIKQNGLKSVRDRFELINMVNDLERLYAG